MRRILFLVFCFSFSVFSAVAQSWQNVGGGISGDSDGDGIGIVCFANYSGNLFAGGAFDSAGGLPVYNIAQWNGTNWSAIGGGVKDVNGVAVYGLSAYDSLLFVSGQFNQVGSKSCKGITQWNGSNWDTVGPGLISMFGAGILCVTHYNNEVYAGNTRIIIQGTKTFNYIERWNGHSWDSLGSGLNNIVSALCVYKGELYVGGAFQTAGGIATSSLARWNGTTWDSVKGGIGGDVYALVVYNGDLYVAGGFTSAGGIPVNNIAKWDGTNWSAVGSGISGGSIIDVFSLCVYNGCLIAGGIFTTAGGKAANQIAAWNGTDWSPIGKGLSGYLNVGVGALGVYDSVLYADGDFTSSGGTKLNCVAMWNGPVGVNEVNNKKEVIKVFPNPSTGVFIFNFSENTGKNNITIYNMLGESIYNTQLNTSTTQIDLSGRPAGIYLYRVVNENGEAVASGKLIVQ
jgi:hypothetical protein